MLGVNIFQLKIIHDKVANSYSFDFHEHAERAVSSIKYSIGTMSEKLRILNYLLPLGTILSCSHSFFSFRWDPPAHAAALLIRKRQVSIWFFRLLFFIPVLRLRDVDQQV